MTLEISRKRYIFKTKEIWLSDYPYNVDDCHNVTFHDCKNKMNIPGFDCFAFTTLVIDLTQDLDTIWGNVGKTCRYKIKRATREGIQIRLNKDYEQFYQMNRTFRLDKGLVPVKQTPETMKRYGTLFTTELDGEIIAGQFYYEDEDSIVYFLGASKRLEVDKEKATLISCGNRLIIWEAIKYAKEKGIKEFDLGGIAVANNRTREDNPRVIAASFKRDFGGRETARYEYQKDYSKIYTLTVRIYALVIVIYERLCQLKHSYVKLLTRIRG